MVANTDAAHHAKVPVAASSMSTAEIVHHSMDMSNLWRGIALLLCINVVLPIVIYNVASGHMDNVYAILLSGVPPTVETLFNMYFYRLYDLVNLIAVLAMVLSVIVTFSTLDAKLAMVKDSFFTFLLGSLYWASIYVGRDNLLCSYYRQYGDPLKQHTAALDRYFLHPGVRKSSNFMCKVWGTAFLVEAVVRVVLIYTVSLDVLVYTSPVLVWGTLIGLIFWNPWYVRYVNAKLGPPIFADEEASHQNDLPHDPATPSDHHAFVLIEEGTPAPLHQTS